MASRMIHYTIAKVISEKIELNNKNEFLVGSLAPDMASYEVDSHPKGIHKRVHFHEELEELGVRGPYWITFYHKYLKENVNDEFALGYFVHLICDTIWLTDIQEKYIYSINKESRNEAIINGYEDMQKCNYHIAKNYGVSYDIYPLQTFSVAEANMEYQTRILKDLKQDFLPYGNNMDFKIHNWNSIINYIEKCIQICLKEVQLVMCNKEPDSPIPYMIPIDCK